MGRRGRGGRRDGGGGGWGLRLEAAAEHGVEEESGSPWAVDAREGESGA